MPRPSAKRGQAGWIAFGIACAVALMGMVVSPRALAGSPTGATLPMNQIYLTAFFGGLTVLSALVAAALLLRRKRIMQMRNLTIVMLILVLILVGLFELNWARGLL